MLRTTAAAFAAGVAGASSVTVQPFDAVIGEPDELARRVARNTQLLLQEESNVARVTDPAGGSYYLERLTDQLVGAAWAELQRIEAGGGLAAGIVDGSLSARYGEVRAIRDRNVARRVDAITGVSEFPNLGEAPVARPVRDVDTLRAPASAGATVRIGPATTCEPLGVFRVAAAFEELRDASDTALARTGARPGVFLANLGPVASHTARATFARNFFEAGGVQALGEVGFDDDEALAAAWTASNCSIAVLCGDDRTYEARAAQAAAALKAAGATWVYLAGDPGDRRAAEEAAGVDRFIHIGIDVLEALRTVHDRLEVNS